MFFEDGAAIVKQDFFFIPAKSAAMLRGTFQPGHQKTRSFASLNSFAAENTVYYFFSIHFYGFICNFFIFKQVIPWPLSSRAGRFHKSNWGVIICHAPSLPTSIKVQLFWEGHKNLELSSICFDIYLVNRMICQNLWSKCNFVPYLLITYVK